MSNRQTLVTPRLNMANKRRELSTISCHQKNTTYRLLLYHRLASQYISIISGDCLNSFNQPPNPPILGDFFKLGDTPKPPAGSILHVFFSGQFKVEWNSNKRLRVSIVATLTMAVPEVRRYISRSISPVSTITQALNLLDVR